MTSENRSNKGTIEEGSSVEKIEFLFKPLSSIKGVGLKLAQLLTKLIGKNRIFDLLLHKPVGVEKVLFCPRLFEVKNDQLVIIKVKAELHTKPDKPRQPFKILCYTPTGYVNLVFFKIFPSQLAKMKIGSELAIFGRFQNIGGENQIIHPQEILPISEISRLPRLNVIYPLIGGVSQKFLTLKIRVVLSEFPIQNGRWLEESFIQQQKWPNFHQALKDFHYFDQEGDEEDFKEKWQIARKRLAYDELLAWQIAVLLAKSAAESSRIISLSLQIPKRNLNADFLSSLPFQLTSAQLKALKEIQDEIFSKKRMLRLLQGDVGSGKTIIAISACLSAFAKEQQSCLLVPTTTLAKQHLGYFQRFLEKFDLRVELLTSATSKKQKAKILSDLANGEIDILISTHAVLEDEVKFKNLGLAVIDEQHRFGVMQRLKLVEKGKAVDVLLMSATPIPRSLMMALYGDMDISVLSEKPQNRQKITTLIMSAKKTAELYEAIKRGLLRKEKIYWICPAIEEEAEKAETSANSQDHKLFASPKVQNDQDLVSAKKKFAEISKVFGEKIVGLLHGKMKDKEKDLVMVEFAKTDGVLKLLVATTVIEVGIDVADATIIVIENAEHFGLAQLHQLRGRVGRSDKKSFCILLYGERFGANARNRLNILRQSDDGFFIAEEDLKMRGSGELLGTKQSGLPEFRIADLNYDADLLKLAHQNAALILEGDPTLKKPQSQKYQDLLRLFGYDDCLRIISGG